jgi:hypothetical protein
MSESLMSTRILAFDFDLCVCDGEGFFELFLQLLDIYEYTRRSITDKGKGYLPERFVDAVEKAYKSLAIDVASAVEKGECFLYRPGIENVFHAAQRMKKLGHIHYIMFYSNNSCPEFLSFVELVIRLANRKMGFSPSKPVVELVFTANTASRMRVEYAPANAPNARHKTRLGILTCLDDLDLPFNKDQTEILFFDDMKHADLGSSLKIVPAYHALHTGKQIGDLFVRCLERAGLFKDGVLLEEWANLNLHNSLMKQPFSAFRDWLGTKDLPARLDEGKIKKEEAICQLMVNEIHTFCGFQDFDKKKSRKRRGKY